MQRMGTDESIEENWRVSGVILQCAQVVTLAEPAITVKTASPENAVS